MAATTLRHGAFAAFAPVARGNRSSLHPSSADINDKRRSFSPAASTSIASRRGHGRRTRRHAAAAAAADDDGDDVAASSPSAAAAAAVAAAEERAGFLKRAMTLRAKAIKTNLALLGVSSGNLFEKEELAKALADAWHAKLANSTVLPLRQLAGIPGNPRAGYVVVTLDVGEAGFVDFLIDSASTTALISPQLREMLGDSATDGAAIRGLGAMGETVRQKVTVEGASVGSKDLGKLDAVVTDIAASGLPAVIGGLLGLEFLSKFEVEFDFVNKTLRFHSPGSVACGALDVSQLVEIPLSTHPTGLKTVRCRLNGCEPFPAIVDMGSFFSVANWMAAASGGVSPDSPEVTQSAMQAVGIDGRTMPMAMAKFDLEVMGVVGSSPDTNGGGGGGGLVSEYKGTCCIGDLPAFASLNAQVSPFMTMGLDVIGRGRTVFVAAEDRVYLTPGKGEGGTYDAQ